MPNPKLRSTRTLAIACAMVAAAVVCIYCYLASAPHAPTGVVAENTRGVVPAPNHLPDQQREPQNVASSKRMPSSRAHSSASGEPSFAQQYASLAAAARSGDKDAAISLQHATEQCREAASILRQSESILALPVGTNSTESSDAMFDWAQRRLAFAKDSAGFCKGVSAQQIDDLPEWTVRAAQTGDTEATHCMLGLGLADMGSFLDGPRWLNQYRDQALPIATSAMDRGDWQAVTSLQSAYAGTADGLLIGHVVRPDAQWAYRYSKLQALGATQQASTKFGLDDQLNTLRAQLAPEQISSADRWAQEKLQNFGGTPSDVSIQKPTDCSSFQ